MAGGSGTAAFLTGSPPAIEQQLKTPPGTEIGAVTQQVGGINGWGSFVDEQEYVPELSWPQSITTYHRMRSDSQNEALHLGTVQPVREYRWSIDPNGAPAALAEQVAQDFGLPIRRHEDENIKIGPEDFQFDSFLDDALLAPLYGHFYFEVVGDSDPGAGEWHMSRMSPRHPRTIAFFQTDNVGDLLGIRQNIGGAGGGGWARMPPPIPAGKLLPFIWRPEAGSHIGRSMLRSLYREWLVKDRTIRVAAISLERGSGVPVIEGPQGASDGQLRDLAKLARQFKIAEGGGGAIPFGSKLTLVGGNVPSAVQLLEYCDACMARVWALMLVQLGMGGSTGNRALGGEFAMYAARAQRSMAKWIQTQVNRFLQRYTFWNKGDGAQYAPRLHFEQDSPDSMSVAELVALIEADAITVDPELEAWIRNEHGLPEPTPPQTDPTLGDLTPEEVALIQNSRNPPALPAAPGTDPTAPVLPKPQAPTGPTELQDEQTQTLARLAEQRRRTRAAASVLDGTAIPLPARQLRRQPNAHEIAAAVNYAQMDATYSDVAEQLVASFQQGVIPSQIQALGAQIINTKAGTPRKVLTRAAMAALQAPLDGQDLIADHLLSAARNGAQAAAQELESQGGLGVIPGDDELAAAIADQINAVVAMAANGISLAAQRKASSLVGGGRTPADVQAAVESYLGGLANDWTARQLRGSVNFAQNVGRSTVFASVEQSAMTYYSSELLDANTCGPCTDVDGTEYLSLADAQQDYAAGGYVDCSGGPNCRGTLIGVYNEQDPSSASNPVVTDVGA